MGVDQSFAVSVVIPSYNRCESMLRLLEDISQQKDIIFEIIVVDDVSTDNTVTRISELFPDVRLFVNEENSGPAVTRNRGIEAAKSEIVVGIDSDVTVPDEYCLKKVYEELKRRPDATGLAFRLLQPDGRTEDFARWWHPLPIERFADAVFETYYFSGTGYAFRKHHILAAGLYPEILYMHYEEVELAYRIIDNGGKIFYTPNISVVHHEHQVSRRSEIKAFYKTRNQILIALACYPVLRGVIWVAPRVLSKFLTSLFTLNFRNFAKILKSAMELAPIRLEERKPLKSETWRRLSNMKKAPSLD